MQSFRTNDRITLKYLDTGAEDAVEGAKPWLILVCCFSRLAGSALRLSPSSVCYLLYLHSMLSCHCDVYTDGGLAYEPMEVGDREILL